MKKYCFIEPDVPKEKAPKPKPQKVDFYFNTDR